MTQEKKELLLRDLCARLPYGLKVCHINLSDEMPKVWDLIGMPAPHLADILVEGSHRFAAVNIEESIRPYLRPMSSMTEEEKVEVSNLFSLRNKLEILATGKIQDDYFTIETIDWLNKHHFDYRGLIPMRLALEAPEGMYNIKTK